MNLDDLSKLVTDILGKAEKLKEKYIEESLSRVDYVGIHPKSIIQQEQFVYLMKQLNAIHIYTYPDNYGILYRLPQPFKTIYGNIDLIAVCTYVRTENKIGYVDFRTKDYRILKEKYGAKAPFRIIKGKKWEMVGLEDIDFDVSLYIPDTPLSKDI